jgi:uncharacterized protein
MRILPALLPVPWAFTLLLIVLLLSMVLMPLALASRRMARLPAREMLVWLGMLAMGLFSSMFVFTVLRDAALIVLLLVDAILPGALAVDRFEQLSGMAVPLLGLSITLLGFVNARRIAQVVKVDVPVSGLPAPLQGFTIVQISDVHVGATIRRNYLAAIVERVNRLGADMVAVTGDLVDGSVADLRDHVAPLAGLSSRHGTFFVTGNHEYYSGAPAWIEELNRLGLRVLLNEHVVLQHGAASGTAPLLIAGVTDYSTVGLGPEHRSDPLRALVGAPADARVRVLLAHQPRSAPAAAEAGYHLQLSGHTHGGQFWPWNHFVRLQQPFTAGLHRLRDLWVYTSRGTGYWGPPKRFGAPSEITLLRLVAA